MLKLLIASRNEGKIQSLLRYCDDCGLETATLKDFPNLGDVEETGETHIENARLKARAYYELTGIPALSDDAGLEIDALGGEPGIKSRRWRDGKTEMTDWEMIDYTLERLRGVPSEQRTARLVTALSFYDGQQYFTATAST